MNFTDWKNNWNNLGKVDPLWAILTHPDKKGGHWDPEEFFEVGRLEIQQVMNRINQLGNKLPTGTALDFGCGAGRLTQALAPHFDQIYGVDIAASMIEKADKFNQFGEKCVYLVNESETLEIFSDDSLDFIYSNIVLQHIPTNHALNYIKEFFRLLKPDGLVIFQILHPTWKRKLFPQSTVDFYRKLKHKNGMLIGMFGVPKNRLNQVFTESSAEVLCADDVTSQDLGWRWKSLKYFVQKNDC